jgi:hypothetical protein
MAQVQSIDFPAFLKAALQDGKATLTFVAKRVLLPSSIG